MKQAFPCWREAREAAQMQADTTGLSLGIEHNTLTREWVIHFLPRPESRFGWELRCEVVDPAQVKRKEDYGY